MSSFVDLVGRKPNARLKCCVATRGACCAGGSELASSARPTTLSAMTWHERLHDQLDHRLPGPRTLQWRRRGIGSAHQSPGASHGLHVCSKTHSQAHNSLSVRSLLTPGAGRQGSISVHPQAQAPGQSESHSSEKFSFGRSTHVSTTWRRRLRGTGACNITGVRREAEEQRWQWVARMAGVSEERMARGGNRIGAFARRGTTTPVRLAHRIRFQQHQSILGDPALFHGGRERHRD